MGVEKQVKGGRGLFSSSMISWLAFVPINIDGVIIVDTHTIRNNYWGVSGFLPIWVL